MAIELVVSQYDALLHYAARGALALQATAEYLELRAAIDRANGIRRYALLIRYQQIPVGPAVIGVTDYPPGLTIRLEQTRAFTRQDIDTALLDKATAPGLVLLTPDEQGLCGWTLLDDFNFETGG